MVQGIGEEVSVQTPRRGSNNARGNRQEKDGDKIIFRCRNTFRLRITLLRYLVSEVTGSCFSAL